ncbi:hypothetical protein BGZ99_010047 [Dissophora globulifera]|uniref:NADP-dependent oxidoreductase domain-containing protein n=1 Tax=Dissophora globulifera TaxID=979702 RepID=A0A9P6RV08_9FUNG|nr:hypothetical protein BGZ99_010047 [Dissophora globulifera]
MTNANTNIPRIVLGTMTFGTETTTTDGVSVVRVYGAENVGKFVEKFHSFGHIELDTARIYGNGDTEIVLSQLPTAHLKISTKVFPAFEGAHDEVNLPKTFRQSLDALKATKVDILYLHAPDYGTPIEVTLKAINDLYKDGLFERFGLSNYPAWRVALIYDHCKENGYVLPSVYQGSYNPISRLVVPELLPCLQHYNISFYAFNVVCGGLLSGKYKFDEEVPSDGGRFDSKLWSGNAFRGLYWNKLNFEGIQILEKAIKPHGISLLEASLRWMRHHSGLTVRDGIILGASSVTHLESNLTDLEKGPLPESIVVAFDEAWEHVKPTAANYFYPPKHSTLKMIKNAN